MSLLIDKDTVYGPSVKASYHRISSYVFDAVHKIVSVELVSYLDKEARDSEALPLTSSSYTFATIVDVGREWIYEQLKARDEFAGAADV